MPGRQSHGRPVTAKPTGRKSQKTASKSRAKTHSNALNAFALAKEQVPEVRKGRLYRELEPEPDLQSKRRRGNNDEDEDDGEEEDDDAGPRRQKRQKLRDNGDDAAESDFGSDSDGNEWHVGVDGDDDDSDIDSDEAFGESDEERFEGYAFGGSSAKDRPRKKGGLSEDEDDEEDDDSLGEDAIDLATALDQYNSDSEDDAPDDKSDLGSDSGSEEDDESSASESPDTDDDDDDSLGDEEDSSKLDALRDLASAFASSGKDDEADDTTAPSRTKIDLSDLGLSGVKDANIKKSLKLLRKEEKASKPGASKKLDVPLAKRQQDRLMRVAALEKTTKTLDKWQDTVKHNRRADHLVFPLPQDLPSAGLDNSELLPLRKEALGSELEQTIMSIMEESGLGPSAKRHAQQIPTVNEDGETLTREQVKEIWNQRRRERELKSREQERAKRIKKIKSKSYRRVHRKEKARDAAKQGSDVEVDSEEEREAHDRRRALERVGAKHRESKWAKMAKNTGRAAWDDDFREGLTDMARREQELRRRVEGRTRENGAEKADSDETSEESGNEEDEKTRLRRKLEKLAADEEEDDDEGPRSALMKMPFMKRAEAAQKKANDEAIAQIARELGSDYDEDDDEPEETMEVGRRTYGMGKDTAVAAVDMDGTESSEDEDGFRRVKTSKQKKAAAAARSGTTGKTKLSKQQINAFTEAMDLSTATADVTLAPKKLLSEPSAVLDDETSASDSEVEVTTRRTPAVVTTTLSASRPRPSRPQLDQIDAAKAFGGADVEAEFLTEKAAVVQEDDDKIVDDSMPGWGSWGGAGVRPLTQKQAAAAAHRRAKYNLSVVPGAKKAANRKDAKLDRVIINEKRIRKNDKYLASQLPHQFESREQYERSLRLPLGPEWSTKGTFQDATKPRILLKQGIIAPMSRPKF